MSSHDDRHMRPGRIEEQNFGVSRLGDDGNLKWKCTLHAYRPEGLTVEREGENLVVNGYDKDPGGSFPLLHAPCRVAIPKGIDKETIRCYIDEHGHVSIEASRGLVKSPSTHLIPVQFRQHSSVSED